MPIDEPRFAPRRTVTSDPKRARVRVLLVDDDADSAELLQMLLTGQGLDVVVARTASAALEAGQRDRFDVVMSDITLPDGDGCELFRKLKLDQPSLVGVAISGVEGEEAVQRCRDAGFAAHFLKPVDIEQLLDAVHRLVSPSNG